MKGRQARDELDDASGWQQKEKARVKDRTGEFKEFSSRKSTEFNSAGLL